jgi:hypothetical protein
MTRAIPKARQPEIQPPGFGPDEEERAFWESHKPGDYLPTTRPVGVQVSRRLRERVHEHKEPHPAHGAFPRPGHQGGCRGAGVPYQTLMRMWIFERLRREKVG